jgi:hypothetical protein
MSQLQLKRFPKKLLVWLVGYSDCINSVQKDKVGTFVAFIYNFTDYFVLLSITPLLNLSGFKVVVHSFTLFYSAAKFIWF